jgi:hypothetical protein
MVHRISLLLAGIAVFFVQPGILRGANALA